MPSCELSTGGAVDEEGYTDPRSVDILNRNIGSKAAVEGCPGAAAYCATKHGVLGCVPSSVPRA